MLLQSIQIIRDWPEIEAAFLNNQIDVLLISPERLANEKFRRGAFQVKSWPGIKGPVLLVDDMVDSRWTMTVVTALLRQAGSGPVYPLALANTAKG